MATINQPIEHQSKPLAIDQWRESLEKILQSHAGIPYRYGDVETYLIVSRDRNHHTLGMASHRLSSSDYFLGNEMMES